MEKTLITFLGVPSLILAIVSSGIVGVFKTIFPEFCNRKWPNRLLHIAPVLIALGLALLPGLGSMVKIESTWVLVAWGASIGFLSSLVYKAVKAFLKKRIRDYDKKDIL